MNEETERATGMDEAVVRRASSREQARAAARREGHRVILAVGVGLLICLGAWMAGVIDEPSALGGQEKAEHYLRARVPFGSEVEAKRVRFEDVLMMADRGEVWFGFKVREPGVKEFHEVSVVVKRRLRWWVVAGWR